MATFGTVMFSKHPNPCSFGVKHTLQRSPISRKPVFNIVSEAHRTRKQFPVCRASDEETATSSVDGIELEAQLKEAIRTEDYAAAAALRDQLQEKEMQDSFAVASANQKFYSAFQNFNHKEMGEVWGEGEHVQCIHPASSCISGRESVLESWKIVLRGAGDMNISLEDLRIHVGQHMAIVTCVEVVTTHDSQGRVSATNIFEKQNGQWVMIHHHGSAVIRR